MIKISQRFAVTDKSKWREHCVMQAKHAIADLRSNGDASVSPGSEILIATNGTSAMWQYPADIEATHVPDYWQKERASI